MVLSGRNSYKLSGQHYNNWNRSLYHDVSPYRPDPNKMSAAQIAPGLSLSFLLSPALACAQAAMDEIEVVASTPLGVSAASDQAGNFQTIDAEELRRQCGASQAEYQADSGDLQTGNNGAGGRSVDHAIDILEKTRRCRRVLVSSRGCRIARRPLQGTSKAYNLLLPVYAALGPNTPYPEPR